MNNNKTKRIRQQKYFKGVSVSDLKTQEEQLLHLIKERDVFFFFFANNLRTRLV